MVVSVGGKTTINSGRRRRVGGGKTLCLSRGKRRSPQCDTSLAVLEFRRKRRVFLHTQAFAFTDALPPFSLSILTPGLLYRLPSPPTGVSTQVFKDCAFRLETLKWKKGDELVDGEERTFTFLADSKEEKERWLYHIRSVFHHIPCRISVREVEQALEKSYKH